MCLKMYNTNIIITCCFCFFYTPLILIVKLPKTNIRIEVLN